MRSKISHSLPITMTSSSAAATIADPDFWPAFEVIDANHDGRIGYDDLKAFYGPRMDEDTIGDMMLAADADKNGYVEYEEFEHVLLAGGGGGGSYESTGRDGEGLGVMREVFRIMDRDGDGLLSSNDLMGDMAGAGLGTTDEEVHAMMRLADGGGGGGVTFDGLLRIMGFSKNA